MPAAPRMSSATAHSRQRDVERTSRFPNMTTSCLQIGLIGLVMFYCFCERRGVSPPVARFHRRADAAPLTFTLKFEKNVGAPPVLHRGTRRKSCDSVQHVTARR